MRCPSCGTDNAPDSRFCGGCGARLEPARVAPTVKLHDDAPVHAPTPLPGSMNLGHLPTPAPGAMSYPHGPASIPPQNHRLASQPGYGPASIPPTNNPASIPPTNNPASIPPTNNPASIPPTNHRLASQPPLSQPPGSPSPGSQPPGQRRASTPAPAALSSPSLSMMPPKRSGAMIAVVLVLDLALAAAGATLLFKGLAKPKAADARPAKSEPHAQTTAAPAPAAVAVTPAPAAAPSEPARSAVPEPPPAPGTTDKTVAHEAKKKAVAGKPDKSEKPDKKTAANGPLDPYAGGGGGAPAPAIDRSSEIEMHARDSFGSFRRCFEDAIHGGPIHGDVRIAFVVQPDGHVDHSSPVVNTTGSDVLASCLAQTIGSWTFMPKSGAASTYERPFNYP